MRDNHRRLLAYLIGELQTAVDEENWNGISSIGNRLRTLVVHRQGLQATADAPKAEAAPAPPPAPAPAPTPASPPPAAPSEWPVEESDPDVDEPDPDAV